MKRSTSLQEKTNFVLLVGSPNGKYGINRMMNDAAWKMSFDIVKLENELANHRLTSMLTIQAALFSFLVLSVGGLGQSALQFFRAYIFCAVFLCCLLGVASPWMIRSGLVAAYRQVIAASEWLKLVHENKDELERHPYPPIRGIPMNENYSFGIPSVMSAEAIDRLNVGTLRLPVLFSLTWIVIALCAAHAVLPTGKPERRSYSPINHQLIHRISGH